MNMEYTGKTTNTQKRKPKGEIKYNIDLNEEQKNAKRLILENDITVLKGQAGSGKTILACLIALDLYNRREIEKIIICRPAVSKEEIGFLPGGADDKLQPYIQPLHNNFYKLYNKQKIDEMIKEGVIQMIPLAYMRGHTFQDSFIIADECLTADTEIAVNWDETKTNTITKTKKLINIINDFKKGEKVDVLSYNHNNNRVEIKNVIHIFENGVKDILNIFINYRKTPIKTTKNHPFAILVNGYVEYKEANDLKIGDNLLRIVKRNSNNARILHGDNYDVLMGLLLGDGSLNFNKQKTKAYRLAINHGLNQKEYGEYCRDIFNGVDRISKSGYTNKPLYGMISKSMIIDDNFISSIYSNGKKKITNKIKDYITERSLAFWYMDDGSIFKNSITLHTSAFSIEENEILVNILKEKFNIESKILFNNEYPYLRINTDNSKKFLSLIEKYIHPNLSYKINNIENENFEMITPKFIDDFTVGQISDITDGENEITYNIEVSDNNNYIANNILVHNCQNLIHTQTELVIGRLGMRSKMVLCGDTSQVDLRNKKESGLSFLSGLDGRVKGFKVITLKENHRHPIVAEVLNIYKEFND